MLKNIINKIFPKKKSEEIDTEKRDKIINWCETFGKFEPIPLNKDQAKIAIDAGLRVDMDSDPRFKKIYESSPMTQLLISRSKCFDYELKLSSIPILNFIAKGNPGIAVMILTYIQYKCKELDHWTVDAKFLYEEIIPWGIPSERHLENLWNQQKVQGSPLSNMLDDESYVKYLKK